MERTEILEACRYLSYIGIWPGPRQMNIDNWLANFDPGADETLALALLESYVHLNEEHIAYATASTVRGFSTRPEFGAARDRQTNWSSFLSEVFVSFPLGGTGDSTASGYIFARLAHQFGLPEERIVDAEHLIERLAESDAPVPVLFLDDLAASGSQFCRNWRRRYPSRDGDISMEDLATQGRLAGVYYLPIVSTRPAKERIEKECGVAVEPTYLLEDDYGSLAASTRIVPSGLRADLQSFLDRYSPRTGKAQYGPSGFGRLGLALSFHHGSPNNTLPILQWGAVHDQWTPLVIEGI